MRREYLTRKWCVFILALAVFMEAESATVFLKINATVPGVSGSVAIRAIIRKADGSYVPGEWDSSGYPVTMHGQAMGPHTVVEIPAGTTEIIVGKGPDYAPQTIVRKFDVPGQTYTVNVALQPVFDLYRKGWRAGDGHVHFNHGENQISRSPDEAFTLLAAGGLTFASLAEEHYGAVTMTRQQMLDTFKKFENTECKLWMGVEQPKNAWGHHVAIVEDPWAIRSAMPYHLGIKTVHDQGGVSYAVHPQRLFPDRFYDDPNTGQRQWALYPRSNHLKSYPLDALLGYLDGWSGLSDQGHSPNLLEPYFKLLSLGYRIPFLADSDATMDRSHNGIKSPGCWISYYRIEGTALTKSAIAHAMRQGRVMSTTGPLVLFTIDGAQSGDTLPPNGSARTARIQASHTFNPWTLGTTMFNSSEPVRISQIDLFRNGEVIQTWNPNTPTADVEFTLNESSPGSHYMVRVLGNENQWMAGYASPIYFDHSPRPRQPDVFKSLINGRLYDAATGAALSGSVSCVRYGKTEWTIQTDAQGLFRAYVPLDAELVAKDASGREFRRDIMTYEPAYAFCHNISENFIGRMGESVDAYKNIVQEMTWEFPIGFQSAASYVKTSLSGNATMSDFGINSAPPATSGKRNTEIVMLIADKTQVRPGDTINYAVVFRQPQGQAPSEELSVQWKGWDPNHPRMYTRYGTVFQYNNAPASLINLGGGFYVRQGSVVVPSWAANATETTAAIKLFATARGVAPEEAILLFPIGPTKRELLISSTWDGFPASWGEIGIGPCQFHRELTADIRYADYRNLSLRLKLNGNPIVIHPKEDTRHAPDADDAVFLDNFYYDFQCEPQNRNVAFRDPVRSQPARPDFSAVPIQTPGGGGGSGGGGGGGGSGDAVASLSVVITGHGTTTPDLNGKELVIGRDYKITAKPQADHVFSHWSGSATSNEQTLEFTMQSNVVLQANFVPNPFSPAKGNFAGLLYDPASPQHESAGFFNLKLTDKGAFTARFIIGGKNASARGKFNAHGTAPLQVKMGKTILTGTLVLDGHQLSGELGNDIWNVPLSGRKMDSSQPASANYTLIIPAMNADSTPAGDGFGTVAIQQNGRVRFAGALADGTVINQSTAVSQDGEWPLYIKLYRGEGSIFGWITLGTNVSGSVIWIRPALQREKMYAAGFTNNISVLGSTYDAKSSPVIRLQEGVISFTGGDLESLESPIALNGSRFSTPSNTSKLSLRLKPSSGSFDGRFRHPTTGKTSRFRGAVLQHQNSGSGFFIGAEENGRVSLRNGE